MATVTDSNDNNPAPENPNKTLDPTLPDPVIVATEPVDDTNATEAAEVKTSPRPESGNDVPLSEKEKCNSRAERCGTGPASHESEPSKSEELKRKAVFSERNFEMEDKGIKQESNTSAAGVYEVPGEPAIVIDGVPDIIPSDCSIVLRDAPSKVETNVASGLGEWFEGREVRKWFMGRYYSGRVTDYDKDSRWYRVHYEDGDSEDLDWQELEEVLLPLDVTVPLNSLAEEVVRRGKISGPKSLKNVDHSQNPHIKRKTSKGQ
ncbi:hypothetical protein DEO72_LG10g68 [Vigna unguiculata]|uniref:PTM/DIR17-like Tudor domain-containing protein n=1 Tax=Vigna unguiculata TaxID=3917 RepID=A0A4D6N4W0_VIGUN|nr:hypothetical protein DEO72_LG10g68 [Vigna unguiculata]